MANTTNYNWETPDDTDLVKDGAAAIRTLGSSVDTTTKALNPSTTLGDIEYRSATANTNTRLGIGTTGQVLTVASGVPSWATPAGGGGKVLQVVQATYSVETTSTSSSYSDTGLSATITPTLNTSKVLVLVSQPLQVRVDSGTNAEGSLNLVRGATEIVQRSSNTLAIVATTGLLQTRQYTSTTYLDSPATTSATTYKTQMRVSTGTSIRSCPEGATTTTAVIILMEIGA